jgi:hypothetical protein
LNFALVSAGRAADDRSIPKPSAMLTMATVSPIFFSSRSLFSSSTSVLAASALVPSIQKLLGQRFASSGARSVTAVAARCG